MSRSIRITILIIASVLLSIQMAHAGAFSDLLKRAAKNEFNHKHVNTKMLTHSSPYVDQIGKKYVRYCEYSNGHSIYTHFAKSSYDNPRCPRSLR